MIVFQHHAVSWVKVTRTGVISSSVLSTDMVGRKFLLVFWCSVRIEGSGRFSESEVTAAESYCPFVHVVCVQLCTCPSDSRSSRPIGKLGATPALDVRQQACMHYLTGSFSPPLFSGLTLAWPSLVAHLARLCPCLAREGGSGGGVTLGCGHPLLANPARDPQHRDRRNGLTEGSGALRYLELRNCGRGPTNLGGWVGVTVSE